jgi:tetratricopeptide (TPR) repeat protein
MPREQTPPPPRLSLPGLGQPAPFAEVNNLHHETECLRLECEAMLHEEMELRTEKDIKGGKDAEASQLRRRITDLLAKAAQQSKKKQAAAEPASPANGQHPPTGQQHSPDHAAPHKPTDGDHSSPGAPPNPFAPSKPTPPAVKQPDNSTPVLTDAPVDPQSLAMALFLTGEYEAALNAYRKLEQEEQKIENHVPLQYMIACCLRKLGKLEEAATLYREVANSGGNEILVENAQWYLRSMKERHELETQLEELRQRRQTAGPKKP